MKRKSILYYSIEIAGVEDERKDALGEALERLERVE
jgi:hypothetical protein